MLGEAVRSSNTHRFESGARPVRAKTFARLIVGEPITFNAESCLAEPRAC